MLLTFMRTRIGADETLFLRYLLRSDIPFQNYDDTSYGHFHARGVVTRLARRLLRGKLLSEMAEDVAEQLHQHDIRCVFVFNGRGMTGELASVLEDVEKVVWFNPDFRRHPEHVHLERIATRILFAKPRAYNLDRFGPSVEPGRITNVNPVMFATRRDAERFLDGFRPAGPSERGTEVAFLGNYSKVKCEALRALSQLLGRRIAVVGGGWKPSNEIDAMGPTYGPHLRQVFSKVGVGVALTDAAQGRLDPITVRYFQYPLLGVMPVLQRTSYNTELLGDELARLTFDNLVEARDRIEEILSMSDDEYRSTLAAVARAVVHITPTAEEIFTRWVLSDDE